MSKLLIDYYLLLVYMFGQLTRKNFTIFIFYGSQTGYAESISQILLSRLRLVIPNVVVSPLNDFMSHDISKDDFVVILLSATGDGEFPDNALSFYRFIRKYDGELSNINYSLLAFGDSNYRSFCHNSKVLDRKLQQLGAVRFKDTVFNDDAVDGTVIIDKWLDEISTYLLDYKSNLFIWFIESLTRTK